MKPNGMLLALALALITATASAQTPPPNDNYANRTVLTGTDLTFSGTLAGATIEDTNEAGFFVFYSFPIYPITKSVWWTWTAPVSTSLTIQWLGQAPGTIASATPELNIYSATDGATSPGVIKGG